MAGSLLWRTMAAALFLVVVVLVMPPPAVGQTGASETEAPAGEISDRVEVLRVSPVEGSDELAIELAVPPSIGELQPSPANFGVLVDGAKVDRVEVRPVQLAPQVLLVVDTSESMQGAALTNSIAAARGFIDRLPDGSRVGLIGFGQTASILAEPTDDREAVSQRVADLSLSGNTALWDALALSADVARQSDVEGSTTVIVLADGDNSAGDTERDDAIAALVDAEVGLYAVGIETAESDFAGLESVADAVGGQYLAADGSDELGGLYDRLAERLANRFELVIDPGTAQVDRIVVSVAVGEGFATASIEPADPESAPTAAGTLGSEPTELPQFLNADANQLGVADPRTPGLLAGEGMGTIGLAALAASLFLLGLALFPFNRSVSLDTAEGVDRVSAINQSLAGGFDRIIRKRDQGGRLERRLDVAGIDLRPGEFMMMASVGVLLIAVFFSALSGPFLGIVVGLIAAAGVFILVSTKADRRRKRFAKQLTDTLTVMSSALRAGRGLPQSIELVAEEASAPTSEEFRRIVFETRVGRDITDAMLDVADRMESQDFEWVAKAVAINRELGGNLTEVLDNVADTIRARQRIQRVVQSLSAEGRMSGWVLLALPVFMFLFVVWRTPDQASLMFTTGLGRIMLLMALFGMFMGYLWIRKLVDLKY